MTAMDKSRLTSGLRAMIGRDPVTVAIGAVSVTGTMAQVSSADRAASGGLLTEYAFSVQTVAADWTVAPAVGDVVAADGTDYRVLRVYKDPARVGLRLDLGAKYAEGGTGGAA